MKLIFKALLFYITVFLVILFMCGIDSLYENNLLTLSICVLGVLVVLCYLTLDLEDLYKFTNTPKDDEDNDSV